MTLATLADDRGPTLLERYAKDLFNQGHERIAVGLKRVPWHSNSMPQWLIQARRPDGFIVSVKRTKRAVLRLRIKKSKGRRDISDSANERAEEEDKKK